MADLEGYLQPEVLPVQGLDLTADAYEDLELDLVNVLENIVDPNTKMLRDLKIDDRDFPEFPNISDFFLNKRGLSIRPFSRQLWILMVLLHEYCPDCSDKKIASSIFNVPIAMAPEELSERMRPLHYGKCTKCGKTKLDFFKAKKLNAYQELAALLGQRTGKSTMLVAPLAVYVLHKYMKMPRPWEMYGLNPTTLFGTVVAQTYQAAAEQLWIPIKTYIEASPWFCDYHGMLKDKQERSGEELFAFLTTQLHYKHRALMIYPSGPNRKTLRGKTRFFCIEGTQRVQAATGWTPISELRVGDKIWQGNKWISITNAQRTGVKPLLRLEVENGNALRCTAEHRILRLTPELKLEWVRASALQLGDQVASIRGVGRSKTTLWSDGVGEFVAKPNGDQTIRARVLNTVRTWQTKSQIAETLEVIPQLLNTYLSDAVRAREMEVRDGEPKQYRSRTRVPAQEKFVLRRSLSLFRIAGYLVSEGSYNKGAREFTFSNTDPRLLADFQKHAQVVFGFSWSAVATGDCVSLRLARAEFKNALRIVGMSASVARTKIVPEFVMRSTDPHEIAAFLSAAFEGDGSWSNNAAVYASSSDSLLEQMQLLFLSLGICTRIDRNRSDARGSLHLDKTGLRLFLAYVQPIKRKVKLSTSRKGVSARAYVLPYASVVDTRLYGGSTTEHVHLEASLSKTEPYKVGYAESHLTKEQQKTLETIRKLNLVFSPLKSKTASGKAETYDIGVDSNYHLFNAQGLAVHNSATDEHDFFDGSEDSEKVKMNGKEVRASLNNSLTNVRIEWRNIIKRGIVNAPGGYSMYVSSPDHAMGVLTQLVKAKEHSKTILAMHLATWDVHPKFTRAAIIKAFDPDPMRLERDFGACPPLNTCPFIEDPETINRMVDPERPNRVQIDVSMEVKMDRARLIPRITKTIIPQRQKGAVLALDAGFSNNSFAMALMSPPLNDKGGLKAVVQALVEMMINKKKKGTVDFHEVYEQLIKPIILQFNVRALVADRWNSLKILHDAQAEFKIHVEQYSLKYADFQNVRSYMESAAIHIPKFGLDKELRENPDLTKYPECFLGNPVDHFYFQSLTVRDLGKTVDKGPGMTDDLWRAFVLGGRFVLDKEFAIKHLRGSEARRAAGGIAAGSYFGSVQGYGNSAPVVHTPGRITNQSPVAASSGGIGGQVVALTPGVFARTPKN